MSISAGAGSVRSASGQPDSVPLARGSHAAGPADERPTPCCPPCAWLPGRGLPPHCTPCHLDGRRHCHRPGAGRHGWHAGAAQQVGPAVHRRVQGLGDGHCGSTGSRGLHTQEVQQSPSPGSPKTKHNPALPAQLIAATLQPTCDLILTHPLMPTRSCPQIRPRCATSQPSCCPSSHFPCPATAPTPRCRACCAAAGGRRQAQSQTSAPTGCSASQRQHTLLSGRQGVHVPSCLLACGQDDTKRGRQPCRVGLASVPAGAGACGAACPIPCLCRPSC